MGDMSGAYNNPMLGLGANLFAADAQNALLAYANLGGATLHGTNLMHASLTCANLQGTNLFQANLEGAIFAWTKFDETTSGTGGSRLSEQQPATGRI